MNEATGQGPRLTWTSLIKKRPGVTQGIPPGKEALAWVANTVTLIQGERDACLVDTFLTAAHAREDADQNGGSCAEFAQVEPAQ